MQRDQAGGMQRDQASAMQRVRASSPDFVRPGMDPADSSVAGAGAGQGHARAAGAGTGRTLIKFCGMVRPEDGVLAASLGVDFVGLVLYAASPRALDLGEAAALRRRLPAHLGVVGLFVNAHPLQVHAARVRIGLDRVQFHGDETPQQCLHSVAGGPVSGSAGGSTCGSAAGSAGGSADGSAEKGNARWWRALRMRDAATLPRAQRDFPACEAFLVDSFAAPHAPSVPALYGGTGKRFDWGLLPAPAERPARLVLSGGLAVENVADAVLAIGPWAVDVSSGIQGSDPRGKDAGKMEAFVAAVRAADQVRRHG